jgi:hypothetical protein
MSSVQPIKSPQPPLAFASSYEQLEDGESDTQRELAQTLEKISRMTSEEYGHAVRSVHAKGQGLLKGTLEIHADLPEVYRQGLFANAKTYPLVMRLSTTPGDILDDHVSTPRGMAIKVIGVEGERLAGSENDVTQDFLLVNGPAFSAPDTKHFLRILKLLASTTGKVPELKRGLAAVFRGAETLLEAAGGGIPELKGLGGHPLTHILGETYYTQTPQLYGTYVAKFSVVPVSEKLRALSGKPVDLRGKPNGLREDVVAFFVGDEGVWDVRVQLCTSIADMPIEDSSVVWPQDRSPFVSVATMHIPTQNAWDAAASEREDALAFNPWHGIAAHRPLGSINRARRVAYAASSQFRAGFNRCPIVEPREG